MENNIERIIEKPIDNVTVDNLYSCLQFLKIEVAPAALDLIIDLVEILEEKGDEISLNDLNFLKEAHNIK